MTITPAIKGQITKAAKAANIVLTFDGHSRRIVRQVLERYMPRQQAKHAARKYLASC